MNVSEASLMTSAQDVFMEIDLAQSAQEYLNLNHNSHPNRSMSHSLSYCLNTLTPPIRMLFNTIFQIKRTDVGALGQRLWVGSKLILDRFLTVHGQTPSEM